MLFGEKNKMKILLINYDHDVVGGCETMYAYLHKAFPNSELISSDKMFKGNQKEISEQLDHYLLEKNKKENILVIKEIELGGVLDTSSVPQINISQNPFRQIMTKYNIGYDPWIFDPKKKVVGEKIVVSNYMKGLEEVKVIPNCVDIDLFKPLEKKNELRIKYNIPEGQKVGIWVGAPNAIKNFQMILNLIEEFQDIFWILFS